MMKFLWLVLLFCGPAYLPRCHSFSVSNIGSQSSSSSSSSRGEPKKEEDGTVVGGNLNDHEGEKRSGKRRTTNADRPRIPILKYSVLNYVCVNKPAGMTVHRSSGSFGHKFVLSTTLKKQLSRKCYPVHRLDHRTSGAMLLALDDSGTCATLQSCLKEGTKTYMALLRGYWHHTSDTLTVDSPIDGKVAITRFTKLATHIGTTNHGTTSNNSTFSKYPPDACTLVACTLEQTGRTHQIRRHAASVLHQPVMGDTQHGDSKINRWWRTERGLNRLALHCLALDLPAPTTLHPPTYMMDNDHNTPAQLDAIQSEQTDRIQITAPLPPDLTSVFQHPEMSDFWRQATQNEPRLSMDPVDLRGGSHGRKYKQKLTTFVEE